MRIPIVHWGGRDIFLYRLLMWVMTKLESQVKLFDHDTLRVVGDDRCSLGEGAHWDARTRSLIWVDILRCCLYVVSNGSPIRYQLSVMPSAIWKVEDRRVFFASDKGVCILELGSGSCSVVLPVEANDPDSRSNDGCAAPDGSFWFGTMLRDPKRNSGNIYRVDAGMSVRKVYEGIGIPNTFLFREITNDILIGDSFERRIYQHSFDGRSLIRESVWLDASDTRNTPDGSCMLANGIVVNAEWDGGRVVAYDDQGVFLTECKLPVSRPTSCVVGGKESETLYITSAREGLSAEQLEREPLAGSTFALQLHQY